MSPHGWVNVGTGREVVAGRCGLAGGGDDNQDFKVTARRPSARARTRAASEGQLRAAKRDGACPPLMIPRQGQRGIASLPIGTVRCLGTTTFPSTDTFPSGSVARSAERSSIRSLARPCSVAPSRVTSAASPPWVLGRSQDNCHLIPRWLLNGAAHLEVDLAHGLRPGGCAWQPPPFHEGQHSEPHLPTRAPGTPLTPP